MDQLLKIKSWSDKAAEITKRHLPTLARKYRQLVRKDDYGTLVDDGFDWEVTYFCEKVIFPEIGPIPLELQWKAKRQASGRTLQSWFGDQPSEAGQPGWPDAIHYMVEQYIKNTPVDAGQLPTDPLQFELWCADVLRSGGWDAQTTKACGD
jgi:hypothetical protein